MDRVRDPLDLFLQRFIELPQRRDRLLHSAMRHLIRGEHLRQELAAGSQQFLVPPLSLRLAKHPLENLMMHGRDFHEALFLGDGAPPQLISAAQRGLAAMLRVFTKRQTIFFVERSRRPRFLFGFRFHLQIPVSRATSTSASSFPRQCCLRILSAALCGDSSAERPSANSPRTPSVTNTRVSPLATGSTAACNAGNCEPTTPPRSSKTSCTFPFLAPLRINATCTLPTPPQVIIPCCGSMEARLNTTPRVARSSSWQRSSKEMTGSSDPALRMATAAFAASAASSPCPIPSIAAIRIPPWLQQTRCWSPDSP